MERGYLALVGFLRRTIPRGLWIWGWVGLGALNVLGVRNRLLLFGALCWIVAALLPYSFLTYMGTVPSRHHYLAAVGYSLITALALQGLLDRTRNLRLVAVLLLVIGLHHSSYLWTSKYRQFEKRSEPIEAFMRFLRDEPRRPIFVYCSDYYFSEARRAAYLRLRETEEHFVLDFSGDQWQFAGLLFAGPCMKRCFTGNALAHKISAAEARSVGPAPQINVI
jgi:hypothetical protein